MMPGRCLSSRSIRSAWAYSSGPATWGPSTCQNVRVTVSSDFPAGRYVVDAYNNGVWFGNNKGNAVQVPGDLGSYVCPGEAGHTISVSIQGVNATVHPVIW